MPRIIFLVDMNAFFISCEVSRNPALRGRPAAVAGDPKKRAGIILAASYEARALGVRTTMTVGEALRLCPTLLLVPPDHRFYEQRSEEVMALLSGYTPLLEQNSIDEAWLDMTGCETLWGTPLQAARRIMDEIDAQLGLWCSIGISENKYLAKIASEMKKPHGITELWLQDVPAKLWPLPAGTLYGVGRKTTAKLASLGLQKIGDVAAVDESFLVGLFGKYGRDLHRHAYGLDDEPVRAHGEDEMKSIGRSTTLPEDITDLAAARRVLLELADDIGRSARRHQHKGHIVQITLKYNDFQVNTRQAPVPATNSTREIYEAGCRLLEQHWNLAKPLRLLGISFSGFEADAASRQITLFDQPTTEPLPTGGGVAGLHLGETGTAAQSDKQAKLDEAMDQIRNRMGKDSVKRGNQIRK
jgi:DNA polymerase IV